MNKRTYKANSDIEDDEDFIVSKNTLGYFVKSKVSNQYTVPLDEAFIGPSYYRNVVSMLMNASEDDSVLFMVNSPGGMLSGLVSLLEGVKMTDATTIAVLVGETASAASIFALHCDQVYVSDNATMLCHNISYGTGGKGSDILSHVQHVSKTSEKLLRSTYEHFLDQKEIDDMINGREIYLDAEDIKQRLELREEILRELNSEEELGTPAFEGKVQPLEISIEKPTPRKSKTKD